MKISILKKIRVAFSILYFLFLVSLFIDFTGLIPESFYDAGLFLQFTPSILIFRNLLTISGLGFLVIIILNLFFGRVYCSFICPLGIMQDVISYITKKIRRLKRYKYYYQKPFLLLRYGFLGAFVLGLLSELTIIISVLDPYSIFGRISSGLLRPIVVNGNNLIVSVLQKFEIYNLYHVDLKPEHWTVIGLSIFFLLLIILFSAFKGRLYCNTICPVGTILGLLSRFSIFRITINKETCTSCRLCERTCKAGCINIPEQKIDFSRCVACYNCLTVCPERSIIYNRVQLKSEITQNKKNNDRRQFLAILALVFTASKVKSQQVVSNSATVKTKRTIAVSPPGSISLDNFNSSCTACHLCISACPTHVLQPSFADYGLIGFMQPVMDNHAGFCNFDCIKCGDVCPTGAIRLLSLDDKRLTQIGKAQFVKENCIVETEGTDCGACAEHCPTKAVHMVPYKNNLVIPEVNEDICIGCGACEYACPTNPFRAIYVEGNSIHLLAKKPEEIEQENKVEEDFPF